MDHKRYYHAIIIFILVLFSSLAFAVNGVLITYPRFIAIDSNGDPLSGGLLYTYEQGTSTPKATYSDYAQTTPHANPVVLDANGEATIYGSGFYKFVLKTSADVTLWTLDNINVSDTYVQDADGDTKIQVEESADEDIIRFDVAGTERFNMQITSLQPSFDNSYDLGTSSKQFKSIYSEMLLGYTQRAKFYYKDADEIYMTAAIYDVDGTMAWWNSALTSPAIVTGGTDWHYLYLDYSEIPTTNVLDNGDMYWSTTEPAWSAAKKGFYHATNTSDRCIFAVYTITNDIEKFYHDGGNYVMWDYARGVTGSQTIPATYTNITTAIPYMPSFAEFGRLYFLFTFNADTQTLYVRADGSSSVGQEVCKIAAGATLCSAIVDMLVVSYLVELTGQTADGTYQLFIQGYFLPIGF